MSNDIENNGFFDSVIVFVKGALIFIVSQAWNSAIQDLIDRSKFFHHYGKLVYALSITLIAVYVLKVIINLKKLLKICKDNLNYECMNIQKILIGGKKCQ